MKASTMKSLKLTALSLAAAMLFGCGGGGGTPGAAGADPSVVVVSDSASALRVSVAGASGSGDSAPSTVLSQAQYTFSANVTAGQHAGQTITGTLLLKTEQEDGETEVEGLLVPTTAAASDGSGASSASAQAEALREQLKATLRDQRSAYRSDVRALLETLKAALEAGRPTDGSRELTAAQKEAIEAFKAAFAERTSRYEADVAAAVQEVRAQLEALGVTLADKRGHRDDEDDDGRREMRGFPVKGTIDATGQLVLKIRYGKRSVVQATGTVAADGSLSGSFTGPGADDSGTWSATAAAAAPAPAPAPAPAGDVASGLSLYNANCSGCHGNSKASATQANTAVKLQSVLASVNNHVNAGLNTRFDQQQLLDLAAYIASPK